MITDKDVQKLGKVLATKEDLRGVEANVKELETHVNGLETHVKEVGIHMNELAGDVVKIDARTEKIEELLKQIPTREEFPQLLEKTFQFAILKSEHERMKKIIREKLCTEV